MAASNVRSRELIGNDEFSHRREVFGQHDSVFYPSSPTCLTPREFELRRGAGFRRTPAYSSMRETRRDDIRTEIGFRERKMSDNFTSDLNQSDIDYRRSMTERTRRISKLRQEFLTSNLHEPSSPVFARGSGVRSSLPAPSLHGTYRLNDSGLYKFPFAEPYGTPPPTRKTMLNGDVIDAAEVEKLRNHLESRVTTLADLMKRYSPRSKPVDMKLPPTKPRVVGTIDKKTTGNTVDRELVLNENGDTVDNEIELKICENACDDDKIANHPHKITKEQNAEFIHQEKLNAELTAPGMKAKKRISHETPVSDKQEVINAAISTENSDEQKPNGELKDSPDVTNELDDKVPEIPRFVKQNSHPRHNPPIDENIPALLQKICHEEPNTSQIEKKSKKRKRSFIDKLLNRNKNK